jgi:rubrerythrin
MHPDHPGRRPDSEQIPDFRVPPSLAGPKRVFVACHYCGYGPSVVPADEVCPKCGGHSWERYALSTRLLPDTYR